MPQVLESDLRKKMAHAHEVYNQAKHALTYFSFQRQRLEDLASQMTARLEAVEGSLAGLSEESSPDHMDTVKVRTHLAHNRALCLVSFRVLLALYVDPFLLPLLLAFRAFSCH